MSGHLSHERPRSLRVGIDIGGTFTDFLLTDDAAGKAWVGKTLTTPDDPSSGVERGLDDLLSRAGVSGAAVQVAVHGTTLVTNAIIERKGDRTALVTTRGFRDAVEIAREHRYDMYDLFLDLPTPVSPRRLRFEVDERLLADGSVYRPLDLDNVARVAERCEGAGVGAVAVCFLHSYRNPEHERAAAAMLARRLPGARISISSEVAGEIREYERTSTTLINAYVQRLVDRYLDLIEARLSALGSSARLLVMLSSGAVATVETAKRFPVRLIESGPAAGALAAAHVGARLGRSSLLSFDMGGTTAKACLIEGGRPLVTNDFEVDRVSRLKRGSGLPVKAPTVEVVEIGAGGGSIARVDRFGLVKVGPDSAGARPGPACYGQGGTEPTVTDADLILGYLNPEFFLGGSMRLDRAAAEEAVRTRVARPLGLELVDAAWAIHHLVNENMAGAARIHAVERGRDARSFPLFAFGGAGPVHGFQVARLLGCGLMIVPRAAGVGSTVGFLIAPPAFDLVRSSYSLLDDVDWNEVRRLFREMELEGRTLLARSGVGESEVSVERAADMRLAGQAHLTRVGLPAGSLDADPPTAVAAAFQATYTGLYARMPPGVPIEVFNWRATVSGPRPALELRDVGADAAGSALKAERRVFWRDAGGFRSTPIYERAALAPGVSLQGPLVVEEAESTTVVGPSGRLQVDADLNLVVDLGD